jgi:hypothetical protein
MRRSEVSHSLAQRGRPAMWANEQEAAVLSGVSCDRFRILVRDWELNGFPKVNQQNGKRSIPAILAYWNFPVGPGLYENNRDDDDGEERWHG